MVLVDTSVLVDFFRAKSTPATLQLESIIDTQLCITPIIFQELLQGARNDSEFSLLRDFLGTQLFCYPTDAVATFERAAGIYFTSRRQGVTIRSSVDCLIAQIAIDNNLPLLHDDYDFVAIAKVSTLQLF